jgi:F-type H+-transporting ATPase subunit delta
MPSDPVARVYAEALFEIGRSRSTVDEFAEELDAFLELTRREEEIFLFLTSPVLDTSVKIDLLRSALEGRLSETTTDFLCLLIRKRRFLAMPAITEVFRGMADDFSGRTRATVRTAIPLSEELQARVRGALDEGLGKRVVLTAETDERLLGGAVVIIGDRVYDGSLSSRLNQFRKQIMRSAGYEDQG